ncbi:malate synthase G [Halalkalibacter okhensis]|uniref:Malate synthase G n=1 Tax=Halalkalibacter okhensis TaxID=333138 RepID=A0A0B0ID55_9BACI|nr:malate synthase G [Halalkalibacter okhensis]KHF37974.1 malate synthase [Halalkalibacter okhensis]
MKNYVNVRNLKVASILYEFINKEALPDSALSKEYFWLEFDKLIHDLTPINLELLKTREDLQTKINGWFKEKKEQFNSDEYEQFLKQIGYLEKECSDFVITTENIDSEISLQSGPQLVVPLSNSRYAINAANARWGSLYDALYGTDVINEEDDAKKREAYNPIRGMKVITFAKDFLDQIIPLANSSHRDITSYSIIEGKLIATIRDGDITTLLDSNMIKGYQGEPSYPTSILFKNNNLHIEVQIDRSDAIGKTDDAGIKDIILESAITTIMDCEDSVAAVDAEDKVLLYRNWLGLIKGTLTSTFKKDNQTIQRTLNRNRIYNSLSNDQFELSGRSLLFVRNVGHLMMCDAVLNQDNQAIPEGILDCVVTSLIAKHDLLKNGKFQNSRENSIYIVKPKMHGSKEVAFSNLLFSRVEQMLELKTSTIKIGVMDEERRTSLNLKNCLSEVKDRIVFINTGFLDRTGDEIHTSMELGPMIPKSLMKTATWLNAYEQSNVSTGLSTGFQGKAYIGKGMWAMPDLMNDMLEQKISQVTAGANTAWVPSPTAAVLHALHYHKVDVRLVQRSLKNHPTKLRKKMLEIPLTQNDRLNSIDIKNELDNNIQGILGYVVRWINQGVGCSKVPDINGIGLMEDRATLRISSQYIANWLYHNVCSEKQVMDTLTRMAKVVDEQNAADLEYTPMSVDLENSIAFQTACELIFKGHEQPNGYTEPILHRRRIQIKDKKMVAK